MCPGQIRGGRIKIKSPAGQKCMSHGQLNSGPRAIISVRGRKYVSHGRLFWPAGDYFGPRSKDDKAYSGGRDIVNIWVYWNLDSIVE